MTRECVTTGSPYEELYGFCRAQRVGERIFIAGTAPIEADGSNTQGGVTEQTQRCLTIIEDAVQELGGSRNDIVRTRMFITDHTYADTVGRVHGAFFGDTRPVATMVVAGLLDKAWLVEIEAEAILTNDDRESA